MQYNTLYVKVYMLKLLFISSTDDYGEQLFWHILDMQNIISESV